MWQLHLLIRGERGGRGPIIILGRRKEALSPTDDGKTVQPSVPWISKFDWKISLLLWPSSERSLDDDCDDKSVVVVVAAVVVVVAVAVAEAVVDPKMCRIPHTEAKKKEQSTTANHGVKRAGLEEIIRRAS